MLRCVRWAQLDGESSCSGDIRIKCRRVVDFKEFISHFREATARAQSGERAFWTYPTWRGAKVTLFNSK